MEHSMGVGQQELCSDEMPLGDRLVADLASSVARLWRWGCDFHDPSGRGAGMRLVPRSVFCACLGFWMEDLGWKADREALQGAGRVDLKLTRGEQLAVAGMSIWGRNDYKETQARIEGSWGPGVGAAAVVMIHGGESETLVGAYRARCLSRPGLTVTELPVPPPIAGRFRVESITRAGFHVRVEHLLVCLPGTRRASVKAPAASLRASHGGGRRRCAGVCPFTGHGSQKLRRAGSG